MDLGMKGRVALITGPVKGMGAAVSLAFAREGCKLALAGRDIAAIEPLARQIRDDGGEALVIACDMTDASGMRNCGQRLRRRRSAPSISWSTWPAVRGRSARPGLRQRRRNSTRSSCSTCAAPST